MLDSHHAADLRWAQNLLAQHGCGEVQPVETGGRLSDRPSGRPLSSNGADEGAAGSAG